MSSARTKGNAFPVSNGLRAPEGPRALLVEFIITASVPASVNIDLLSAKMSFVQSIFIDNSPNPNPVTILVGITGQTITAQANTQVFLPLLIPMSTVNMTCEYAGDATVLVQLLNVPISPIIYAAQPAVLNVTGTVNTIPPATQAVTQSGAWSVAQSGAWSVSASQLGTWNVGQFGAWSVGQSGVWTVGATQSGNWNIQTFGATQSALAIGVATTLKIGSGRLYAVNVVVAGAANGFITDNGVNIMSFPNAIGTFTFPGGFPFTTNLRVVPGGGGQQVSLAWD